MKVARRLPKILPVLRPVKTPDCSERRRWSQCSPFQRNHVIAGKLNACFIFEGNEFLILGISFVLQRSKSIGDDRSVTSQPNSNFERVTADNADCLLASFEIYPLAIDFILIWIVRVDLFNIEIHHIGTDIGEAPGNFIRVTDNDTGY